MNLEMDACRAEARDFFFLTCAIAGVVSAPGDGRGAGLVQKLLGGAAGGAAACGQVRHPVCL